MIFFTADSSPSGIINTPEFDLYSDAIRRSRNTLTFGGLTALRLMGFPELKHNIVNRYPVQVCIASGLNRSTIMGVQFINWPIAYQVSNHEINSQMVEIVDPTTAALQALRSLGHVEAVVLFDALLSRNSLHRQVIRAELERLLYASERFKGKTVGKWALDRCVEGTDSPMESRLRVKLQQSRFPRPVVNYKIHHPHTGENWFADLAFPKLKIAIEYQGAEFHTSKESLSKDSRKISALQGLNWNVIPVTSNEIFIPAHWDRFVDTLRAIISSKSA
jgi:very-short-patch-repair endonuclease